MADTSSAVSLDWVSAILGYSIQKGFFNPSNPNLPQRIALLGEANTANQSSFTAGLPIEITSAADAASTFGWGSPTYAIARILFPTNGNRVNCPVFVYPVAEAATKHARVSTLTIGGAATSLTGGTIYLVVAGRTNIDGYSYAVNVTAGDTQATVAAAINAVINGVLPAPITSTVSTNVVTTTTKWKSATADLTNTTVIDDIGTGFTYTLLGTSAGIGIGDLSPSLNAFGDDWNTIVINGLGFVAGSTPITTLNAFNGVPDPTNPTGRYAGIIMKPFIAVSGSVADNPTTLANYPDDLTVAVAPAPLSQGYGFEAAANVAYLFANLLTNAPHLDIMNMSYPDMPLPLSTATPAMQSATTRNTYVKAGSSTCKIIAGKYQITDFVTTYHPDGENPPIFRYCRDIMGVDMNIYFGWKLIEQQSIQGHIICNDNDIVTATKTITPKQVLALIAGYAADLVKRGLIVDAAFMIANSTCVINATNPQRLDITYSYKRSGDARIVATTVTAGFNFGN